MFTGQYGARSVVSYGAGKGVMTSSPTGSHRADHLGDLSRTTSMSSNLDQKPYLQSFQAMNQPLCATCAACPTCGPARYQSFAQQMQEKQQNELLLMMQMAVRGLRTGSWVTLFIYLSNFSGLLRSEENNI